MHAVNDSKITRARAAEALRAAGEHVARETGRPIDLSDMRESRSLKEIGIDSLSSMEVIAHVEDSLDIEVSSPRRWRATTLGDLIDAICEG